MPFQIDDYRSNDRSSSSFNYLSPSTFYYSLTNINDFDDQLSLDRSRSKFDVGYASDDDQIDKTRLKTSFSLPCLNKLRDSSSIDDSMEKDLSQRSVNYAFDSNIDRSGEPASIYWDDYQESLSFLQDEAVCSWAAIQTDSDSELDEFNNFIDESERQLKRTRFSLEQNHQTSFTEISGRCQTNIEFLEDILINNFRSMNKTQTIEQIQASLSSWYDMRDRTRARHLLHISQEIIRFKLRLDDELSLIEKLFDLSRSSPLISLRQFKQDLYHRINLIQNHRQKIEFLQNDFQICDEHVRQYNLIEFQGPSAINLEEYLKKNHRQLEQIREKMDSYQFQLHSVLNLIDEILPIENEIEEKLSECNEQCDFSNLEDLIEHYHRLIPTENEDPLVLTVKNHCERKLRFYRTTIDESNRKLFSNASANFNNNNSSSVIASTNDEDFRRTPTIDGRNEQHKTSTCSFFSEDCKFFYIETVIEIDKPVFCDRHLASSNQSKSENMSQTDTSTDESPETQQRKPARRSQNSDEGNENGEFDSMPAYHEQNHRRANGNSLRRRFDEQFQGDRNSLRNENHQEFGDKFYPNRFRERPVRPTIEPSQPCSATRCFLAFCIGFLLLLCCFVLCFARLDYGTRFKLVKSFISNILVIEVGRPIL